MKALVCRSFGPIDSLVVEDLPDPAPLAGQVVIGVRACGVNFPDVLIVQGKYQFKPALPFSPGGEVAGVVESVGNGVNGLHVGDRVVGMAAWGGMAEKMAVDASQVLPIPDGVDFVSASCVASAHGTTLYALRDRAKLEAGETLLVLGAAGGLGLAAVQIGKRMGARVIAAASTPEKLETCRKHGADLLIDYAKEDLKAQVKAMTGGAGADVVYDPVGGTMTEAAVRSIAWEGRLLVLGFTAGDIPKLPLNLVLLKGCSVVGVYWGMSVMRDPAHGRAILQEILGWLQDGSLRPHVHVSVPLSRSLDALRAIEERRVQGKAVVVVGGEGS
jgi:NADPH2:quinone reductase